MSTTATAAVPAEPEATISAEWMWLEVEGALLVAEVEDFLASARTPTRSPPRTRTRPAGLPTPGAGPAVDIVPRPPRRVPAANVRSRERAPPRHPCAVPDPTAHV